VQREFLHNFGTSINYVGTRRVRGYTREDYNRFDGDVCNPTQCNFFATRRVPGWGAITYISNESSSTYHGLNAQLKKRYDHGVLFVANYTFGKVLDNVTEGGLGDYFNTNAYAGNYSGVMDIQHPQLPSFHGERYLGRARPQRWPVPRQIASLGGWQLNSTFTLQSEGRLTWIVSLPGSTAMTSIWMATITRGQTLYQA
jgi:hypothetical protein